MRDRSHKARHTAGGANGKVDIPFGQPQLTSRTEIRRHGAKWQLTIAVVLKRHNLTELVKDAFTAKQPTALPRKVHQAQHVPVTEGSHPRFKFRQFAARIGGTYQRSNRTSCNNIDIDAHLV